MYLSLIEVLVSSWVWLPALRRRALHHLRQHAIDKGPKLVFAGETRRLTRSEMLDASPMADLRLPGLRSKLDHEGTVGGQWTVRS
jgi:hypothetical protein